VVAISAEDDPFVVSFMIWHVRCGAVRETRRIWSAVLSACRVGRLRRAIHRIKSAWGLGGRDRVTIWDDGSVTDENGAHLGNIFDEG
jgi:hypothetical protein